MAAVLNISLLLVAEAVVAQQTQCAEVEEEPVGF
jgi:hypothetical protein